MKNRNLYQTLLIAIISVSMMSCSKVSLDQPINEAGSYSGRIDIAINGAFDDSYYLNGDESILTFGSESADIAGASTLNLQISKNERIELIVKNSAISEAWNVPFSYSAFSSLILPMRDTYVIANYYSKEVLTYSTTSGSAAEDHIQTYVLEIIASNGEQLLARFHEMQLFPVGDNLNNQRPITIKGTFNTTF